MSEKSARGRAVGVPGEAWAGGLELDRPMTRAEADDWLDYLKRVDGYAGEFVPPLIGR